MSQFLPQYIYNDKDLPTRYAYTALLLFDADATTWHWDWTNIKYSDAQFDITDIEL